MRRPIFGLKGGLAAVLACTLAGPALAATGSTDDIASAEAAAFSEADANGDGVLSATEFESFHELLRQKLDALRFSQLDTNGDGGLSLDEIRAGRPPGPPPGAF